MGKFECFLLSGAVSSNIKSFVMLTKDCSYSEHHLTMLVSQTWYLRMQHSHGSVSHTLLCGVSQGGITAIDLSPSSEDIIASAGKDHTVQIYDRSASHSCPLHAIHTVRIHSFASSHALCIQVEHIHMADGQYFRKQSADACGQRCIEVSCVISSRPIGHHHHHSASTSIHVRLISIAIACCRHSLPTSVFAV